VPIDPYFLFILTERFKAGNTQVFCAFTSTALLVAFKLRDHVLIYSYTLSRLQSDMVPLAGATHKPLPIAPDVTYRIELEGHNSFEDDIWSYRWVPQIKPVAAGQLRLLSWPLYIAPNYTLMMAPLQWPPPFTTRLSPQDPITIKCPVTFLRKVSIDRSVYDRALWTSENPKKNIAWIYWDQGDHYPGSSWGVRNIAFADAGSVHSPPEAELKPEDHDGTVGVYFTTKYPVHLDEHGMVLSMDMDDANGRLIMSMEDGTLAVMEFV
jgi:hypothetical protein